MPCEEWNVMQFGTSWWQHLCAGDLEIAIKSLPVTNRLVVLNALD